RAGTSGGIHRCTCRGWGVGRRPLPHERTLAGGVPPMAGLPMTATLSKSQRAYRSIKAKIYDGSYSPGYRLVLNRLAAELQVSTVPVREAIRMLEAEGLVHFERNIGAQVAMIDPTQYQVTME